MTAEKEFTIPKPFCIPAPTNNDNSELLTGLVLLEQQDAVLQRSKGFLDELFIEEKDNGWEGKNQQSIRKIGGNRFEIFVECTAKRSAALERVLGKMLGFGEQERISWTPDKYQNNSIQIHKEKIVRYCKEQATRGSMGPKKDWDFDNFAILVHHTRVPQQAPHIDIISQNMMMGCMVSEACPVTKFWDTEPEINDVEGLEKLWGDIPHDLKTLFLEESPEMIDIRTLIQDFGNVLYRPSNMKVRLPQVHDGEESVGEVEEKLKRGTIVISGARTVHAGPAWGGYRAILFFTAAPKHLPEDERYDPNIQESGVTLLSEIIMRTWKRTNKEGRMFMLKKLCELVDEYKMKKIYFQKHFHKKFEAEYRDFLKNIEMTTWPQKKLKRSKEEYLDWFATTWQGVVYPANE